MSATFVRAGEVHDAPNKARHGCGRPRNGERAVSSWAGRWYIWRQDGFTGRRSAFM